MSINKSFIQFFSNSLILTILIFKINLIQLIDIGNSKCSESVMECATAYEDDINTARRMEINMPRGAAQ